MSLDDFSSNHVKISEQDNIVIATPSAQELSEESHTEQLGKYLFDLVEQYNCRNLVLDLSGVGYVTSFALGKMISLHRKIHRHGGKLVLCHVCGVLSDILTNSRLVTYFNISDNVQAAVAEFS